MTDNEWLKQIQSISNEELMNSLEWCGHDGYYNSIYYPIIKELRRRLGVERSKQCSCYHIEYLKSYCYGTKEKELCSCDGDKSKCNFYNLTSQ